VLAAYAVGLPAVVLIRSMLASFHARADTTTPLIASFAGVGVNVALKIVLTGPFGAAGLALATSAGAWVNILLLAGLAYRRGWTAPNGTLGRTAIAVVGACVVLAIVTLAARAPLAEALTALPRWRDEILLAALAASGGIAYGGALVVGARLLGVRLARR